MATIYSSTFDTNSITTIIAAQGAGLKSKIVAISIHNNDSDKYAVWVRLISGAGNEIYGGGIGAVRLKGRGDVWVLPFKIVKGEPQVYMESNVNTNVTLAVHSAGGYQISGCVWYIKEA